jgi:uncharacterized protein (DUF4213/DUF364 family)
MTIASELIALLEGFAARSALPRIRALHLPPPSAAGTKSGEFCAVELDDGSIGLSYVLLGDTLVALCADAGSAALGGADSLEVARWYQSASGARRTVGFAVVNALTRCLFERAGFIPDSAADSIGLLDPQPGEHIGMIGFFSPLVPRIVAAGARLTVAELNPALAGEGAGYRVTLDPTELASCGKVLSTSTVLLNHTLDDVLANCRSAQYFAMVGPGAGCLPDPLFARGVTLLGGNWICARDGFVDALKHGRPWGTHARKFALLRDDYPGAAALLERVGRLTRNSHTRPATPGSRALLGGAA